MNNTTDYKMDPKTDHGRDYKMESAALYFVVSSARLYSTLTVSQVMMVLYLMMVTLMIRINFRLKVNK